MEYRLGPCCFFSFSLFFNQLNILLFFCGGGGAGEWVATGGGGEGAHSRHFKMD